MRDMTLQAHPVCRINTSCLLKYGLLTAKLQPLLNIKRKNGLFLINFLNFALAFEDGFHLNSDCLRCTLIEFLESAGGIPEPTGGGDPGSQTSLRIWNPPKAYLKPTGGGGPGTRTCLEFVF